MDKDPCQHCGSTDFFDDPYMERGEIVRVKRTCRNCGRYVKWVPKSEFGIEPRRVNGRSPIPVSRRKQVFVRDNSRCVLCGADGSKTSLHLSHIISVDEGRKYGLSDDQINAVDNLVCLCEECNLGFGRQSLPMSTALRLVHVQRLAEWVSHDT